MPESLVVGTAGHIDHGKTALVRALTGMDADRLEEEKRRGITIDLGFAHSSTADGHVIAFVDVPGHEGFIRNMVAGVSGIDAALLVVAADEGVMPQTREHVAILGFLGVGRAVVAITKADLVDREWLELVREEVSETLAGTPLAQAPMHAVSSRTGDGLESLRERLGELVEPAHRVREPGRDDLFRMPVDRAFTVHGTGTVVTGTVWHGSLTPEQEVRVLPSDRTARVRGLQRHHEAVPRISGGERAAVALAGVEHAATTRGAVLVVGDAWHPSTILTAHLATLPSAVLRQRDRVRVHIGTAEVMARIALLEEGPIDAAGGLAQLRLERPCVARAGDRVVLRSYSPLTTIGGGTILEPLAGRRSRTGGELRALHRAARGREPGTGMLRVLARAAGTRGVARDTLPIRLGVSPGAVRDAERHSTLLVLGSGVYARDVVEPLCDSLIEQVASYHGTHPLRAGMPHAELMSAHTSVPQELREYALEQALTDALRRHDGVIATVEHRVEPDNEQSAALQALARTYERAGLEPPLIAELPAALARRADLHDLLGYLERDETLVPVGEGRWLHAQHVSDIEKRVRSRLAGETGLSPTDFRACLPVSRKHLIPLLEFLDGRGVTRRDGTTRSVPA